jgi:hypothetical protein
MTIDSNIALGVKPIEVQNPLNAMAQVMQIQGAQNQNAMAQYGLAKAKRVDDQQNALMSALQGGGIDLSTPEGQMKAISIAPDAAGPIIKAAADAQVARSTVGKNDAETGKFGAQTTDIAVKQYRDALNNINDPTSAAQWLSSQYADPRTAKVMQSLGPLDQAVSRIPTDPAQFATWKQQQALGMAKYTELNKPTTSVVNAGGVSQVLQTPGLGGAPQTVAQVQHTVSPDAVLQANTSRANNAATIDAANLRAGFGPGGTISPDMETTAQAIANGQLMPPTGAALLNPRNQRVLGRVMEINPNYDATSILAKKKAASDFTTGALGNSLRSFAVAGQHLDQLGALADAMNNGNVQLVNQLGNTIAAQTGSPAPTNFNAAKDVVSKEVMKAIVAGGGGVAEREELNKTMSAANSPAQLKGVIQQYRNLMAAQHDALLQQRRAAGLPDSTLPAYSVGNDGGAAGAGSVPAAPAGWSYVGPVKGQ